MNDTPTRFDAHTQRPAVPPMSVLVSGRSRYLIQTRLLILVLVLALGGWLFYWAATTPVGIPSPVLVAIPIVLVLVFLITLQMIHARLAAQISQLQNQNYSCSDFEFASWVGDCWPPAAGRKLIRSALEALYARGFVNRVLFLYEDLPPRFQFEPIEFPFQPTPLHEADAAFRELEAGLQDAERSGSATNRICGARKTMYRRIHPQIYLTGFLIFYVIFALIVGSVYYRLSSGTGSINYFIYLQLILPFIFLAPTWYRFRAEKWRWILVPGGLVLRRPRRHTAGSDVHLFVRERSVIVIRRASLLFWKVNIWDGKELGLAHLRASEVELLLRAWLSPLAPPPVEKLVDLT